MVKKVKCCRGAELKLSNLWVASHDKLSDFSASSWQRGDSAVPMLVIRLVLLAIALSILGWSLYEAFSVYWLVYLTNWGLLLVSTMLLSGTIVSIKGVFDRNTFELEEKGLLPWFVRVHWFLSNVSVTLAILISCLYWILIFDPEQMMLQKNMGNTAFVVMDVLTHGVNSSLAVFELLLARTPVQWLHILQPLALGLWYAAFTVIYYVAGGTDGKGSPYIYPVLDWRESQQASITVLIAAAGLLLIYCCVYGIAAGRDKLSTWLLRSSSVELPHVPPDIRSTHSDLV